MPGGPRVRCAVATVGGADIRVCLLRRQKHSRQTGMSAPPTERLRCVILPAPAEFALYWCRFLRKRILQFADCSPHPDSPGQIRGPCRPHLAPPRTGAVERGLQAHLCRQAECAWRRVDGRVSLEWKELLAPGTFGQLAPRQRGTAQQDQTNVSCRVPGIEGAIAGRLRFRVDPHSAAQRADHGAGEGILVEGVGAPAKTDAITPQRHPVRHSR